MVVYGLNFAKYLKNMMDFNENTGIELTLMCIPQMDGEGGLSSFKVFLGEKTNNHELLCSYKTFINDCPIYNVFCSEYLFVNFNSMKIEVETERMIELYGKERYEENFEDVIENNAIPLPNDYSEEKIGEIAWDKICQKYAEKIEYKTLKIMDKEKLDNKYYGFRDEENNPIPIDRQNYIVYDNQGNELVQVIYGEELKNNKAYIIKQKLAWKEDILVSIDEVKKGLELAKTTLKPAEIEIDCEINSDCSLVYVLPNETYEVVKIKDRII